jgi:hypothetical protein
MAVEPVVPGVVKVILDGRLDITGASVIDLQFSAIAGSHKGIVVDLANVSFLASIGSERYCWAPNRCNVAAAPLSCSIPLPKWSAC